MEHNGCCEQLDNVISTALESLKDVSVLADIHLLNDGRGINVPISLIITSEEQKKEMLDKIENLRASCLDYVRTPLKILAIIDGLKKEVNKFGGKKDEHEL